jgi:hypothetical protein
MNHRERRFLVLAAISYHAYEEHRQFIEDQWEDGEEATEEAEEFIRQHRAEVEGLADRLPEVVLKGLGTP